MGDQLSWVPYLLISIAQFAADLIYSKQGTERIAKWLDVLAWPSGPAFSSNEQIMLSIVSRRAMSTASRLNSYPYSEILQQRPVDLEPWSCHPWD